MIPFSGLTHRDLSGRGVVDGLISSLPKGDCEVHPGGLFHRPFQPRLRSATALPVQPIIFSLGTPASSFPTERKPHDPCLNNRSGTTLPKASLPRFQMIRIDPSYIYETLGLLFSQKNFHF